jgi:tetratricopeptide (TPR) repeat protein
MNEARQLWQQILHRPAWAVSVPNRASAYYGMCRQAARQARNAPDADEAGEGVERTHYLAYYYCKQAAALYASLSDASRAKPTIKTGEAAVLHALGMTVGRLQREPYTGSRPEWDCGGRWRKLHQSPYSRSALRYYRQALALLPDDYRIRCSEARTAYVLEDPEPMHRLRADPGAHVALAQRYRKAAKARMADADSALDAHSYRTALTKSQEALLEEALTEYQKALDLEPTHIEALTGYAFTFFKEWRADLWPTKDPDAAQRAGQYACKAIELAADKLDPVIKSVARCEPGPPGAPKLQDTVGAL